MQPALDGLLAILDLEEIEVNIFRGRDGKLVVSVAQEGLIRPVAPVSER